MLWRPRFVSPVDFGMIYVTLISTTGVGQCHVRLVPEQPCVTVVIMGPCSEHIPHPQICGA